MKQVCIKFVEALKELKAKVVQWVGEKDKLERTLLKKVEHDLDDIYVVHRSGAIS